MRQAITEALARLVQPCWLPPQNADGEAVVRLQISPDGELSWPPELEYGDEGKGTLSVSALRAVQACAPYPSVGELTGDEPISIRATFSLTGFSAVRGEQALRPGRERNDPRRGRYCPARASASRALLCRPGRWWAAGGVY